MSFFFERSLCATPTTALCVRPQIKSGTPPNCWTVFMAQLNEPTTPIHRLEMEAVFSKAVQVLAWCDLQGDSGRRWQKMERRSILKVAIFCHIFSLLKNLLLYFLKY